MSKRIITLIIAVLLLILAGMMLCILWIKQFSDDQFIRRLVRRPGTHAEPLHRLSLTHSDHIRSQNG